MSHTQNVADTLKSIVGNCHLTFFTKPNCYLCIDLEKYLNTNKIVYNKVDVSHFDNDIGLDIIDHLKQTYDVKSYPICFIDGMFIGSFKEAISCLSAQCETSSFATMTP
jgi:glutaredoxin